MAGSAAVDPAVISLVQSCLANPSWLPAVLAAAQTGAMSDAATAGAALTSLMSDVPDECTSLAQNVSELASSHTISSSGGSVSVEESVRMCVPAYGNIKLPNHDEPMGVQDAIDALPLPEWATSWLDDSSLDAINAQVEAMGVMSGCPAGYACLPLLDELHSANPLAASLVGACSACMLGQVRRLLLAFPPFARLSLAFRSPFAQVAKGAPRPARMAGGAARARAQTHAHNLRLPSDGPSLPLAASPPIVASLAQFCPANTTNPLRLEGFNRCPVGYSCDEPGVAVQCGAGRFCPEGSAFGGLPCPTSTSVWVAANVRADAEPTRLPFFCPCCCPCRPPERCHAERCHTIHLACMRLALLAC